MEVCTNSVYTIMHILVCTGQIECVPGKCLEMYRTVKVLYKCESDKDGKKYINTLYTVLIVCIIWIMIM